MESEKTKTAEASAVFATPIDEQNEPEKPENGGIDNCWSNPVTSSQLLQALLSYAAGWLFVRSFLCP